jgi:hypothetical protein
MGVLHLKLFVNTFIYHFCLKKLLRKRVVLLNEGMVSW